MLPISQVIPSSRRGHQITFDMTAELRLKESQKFEVGKLITRLNKNGCFIRASLYGNVLRVCETKEEIDLIKAGVVKDS